MRTCMQTGLATQRCMSAADISCVCKYGYHCSVMPDVHAWGAQLVSKSVSLLCLLPCVPLRTSSAAVPPQKRKEKVYAFQQS